MENMQACIADKIEAESSALCGEVMTDVLRLLLLFLLGLIVIFSVSKRGKVSRKNGMKILLAVVLCVGVLEGIVTVFLYRERYELTKNLKKDLEDTQLLSGSGLVEDSYTYERGGTALIINGQTYYVMRNLGEMQSGKEYEFEYLAHARYIVHFTVPNPPTPPESATVDAADAALFGPPKYDFPIEYVASFDDIGFGYVKNYYAQKLNEDDYQKFINMGWQWYAYPVHDDTDYQCDFALANAAIQIHIIFSTTSGEVKWFWITGDDSQIGISLR